jgi:hypothetical protein
MLFRIACYYLLLGVEQFQERKLEESVEQLTVAYIVNQRLLEDPPIMANPKLKVNLLPVLRIRIHVFFGPPESGSISQRYGSGFRIRLRIRILLSLSENSKKNLDFYCFVTSF